MCSFEPGAEVQWAPLVLCSVFTALADSGSSFQPSSFCYCRGHSDYNLYSRGARLQSASTDNPADWPLYGLKVCVCVWFFFCVCALVS